MDTRGIDAIGDSGNLHGHGLDGMWKFVPALFTGGMPAVQGVIFRALKDEGIRFIIDQIIARFQDSGEAE